MTNLQKISRQAISLMDLTSLNDNDTEQDIVTLCNNAHTVAVDTAAVCIYPRFIPIARKTLRSQNTPNIKIATVTNFPHGNDDLAIALAETRAAIAYGADEVDVVFPYRALMAGNDNIGMDIISACRDICVDKTLKVIIESGELNEVQLIKQASQISIDAGADFIKTSTGKVAVNATLDAAKIMLSVIRDSQANVGFKAAGGVQDAVTARQYIELAQTIMGSNWISAEHFRFGASSLLSSLLAELNLLEQAKTKGRY